MKLNRGVGVGEGEEKKASLSAAMKANVEGGCVERMKLAAKRGES